MAERDTFVELSDGDQLNEGYFNGNFTRMTKYTLSTAATISIPSARTVYTTELQGTITPDSSDNFLIACRLSATGQVPDAGLLDIRLKIGNFNTQTGISGTTGDLLFINSVGSNETVTQTYLIGRVSETQINNNNSDIAPMDVPLLQTSYLIEVQVVPDSIDSAATIISMTADIFMIQGPMDTVTITES